MRVGTVREIKNHEYRVGLTPKASANSPRMDTMSGSKPGRGLVSVRLTGITKRQARRSRSMLLQSLQAANWW